MPVIKKIEYYIDEKTNCFICTSHKISKKYACPEVTRNGHREKISRYIYKKFNGTIPTGYVIRHTCDNPACINPKHLIIGTHADNVSDRVNRDRSAYGESNGRHKLTKSDVIRIYFSRKSTTELCQLYHVDGRVIRDIWYKRTWKKITNNFLPMWHINKNYYNSKKINI